MKNYKVKNTPQDNVEVEGGETVKLPNYSTFKFEGNSHAEGGIDTYLPEGSMVFSDKVKLPKEVVSAILGKQVNKKKTPAELSKQFDTTKYLAIINDKKGLYDDKAKKTAEVMLQKNLTAQDSIFTAQEAIKEGINTSPEFFSYGGRIEKYQDGGLFENTPKFEDYPIKLSALDTLGFSTEDPDPTKSGHYINLNGKTYKLGNKNEGDTLPFDLITHPYITDGIYKNYEFNGKNASIIKDYQQKMLGLDSNNKNLSDEQSVTRQKNYLDFYFKSGMVPWNHSKPLYGNINGQRTQLTPENYSTASDIDFSPIVDGDTDYQQLLSYGLPLISDESQALKFKNKPVNTLPQVNPVLQSGNNLTLNTPPINTTPEEGNNSFFSIQDRINGVAQADLLGQLLSLYKKPAEYTFAPKNVAYTRFEPINTRAQERAFNSAKESIMNSNLPEQVKQAQLAQLNANLQDQIGNVALQNQQGDLANDNRNIEVFRTAYDFNTAEKARANYQYRVDNDRAEYLKQAQAQEIKNNMHEIWRKTAENKTNLSMINELSQRYKFDPNTIKAIYQKGKGANNDFSVLDAILIAQQQNQQTASKKE